MLLYTAHQLSGDNRKNKKDEMRKDLYFVLPSTGLEPVYRWNKPSTAPAWVPVWSNWRPVLFMSVWTGKGHPFISGRLWPCIAPQSDKPIKMLRRLNWVEEGIFNCCVCTGLAPVTVDGQQPLCTDTLLSWKGANYAYTASLVVPFAGVEPATSLRWLPIRAPYPWGYVERKFTRAPVTGEDSLVKKNSNSAS